MCFKQKQIKRLGAFLFGVLIAFSVRSSALDVRATTPQTRVLALYDGRPDLPANVIVDDIIRSTLERELGPRLDFYTEFIDTARWPQGETQSAVHDYLRRRYAHKKLSAVIAVAQSAIDFIHLYGNELFPGVPIVVYGPVDALRGWEPGRSVTGTLAKLDLSGTVELILRLQPGTREIIVISGTSSRDQFLQSIARPQFEEFQKRVKFTYLTGVAVDDLERTATQAPDGTAIFFLSMFQDSAGNNFLSNEVLSRIASVARVPIYSQSGLNLGRGIVGGVVFDPESLGRETAQLTLRVLRGERLQDLPLQESKSTVPMVDWRQLRRWRLDEKRLPAGTVVRFREASVWQTYRWYIVGAVCLVMLQTIMILGLLLQRRKRRKAEKELDLTYERLRLSVEAGRTVAWEFDVKTGENYWLGDLQTMFGIPSDSYYGRAGDLERRVLPEDWGPVASAIENARKHRQPYNAEFRILRDDQTIRWIAARGKFYYATNGVPERMLGIAVDITERKIAEESLATLGRRLIETQEQERTRIGRELHDDINQRLALVSVMLDRHSSKSSDIVEEARRQISEIAGDVQALSHRLHSSKLEYLGLCVAAKSFCKEFSEKHNVHVDFIENSVPRTLPEEVALCLFRVLQEALQNAVKYSGANHFEVDLSGTSADIRLRVRDFGRGFNVDDAMKTKGLGLVSMRERVNLVKGEIVINSKPMAGTEISVRVPVRITDLASEVSSGAA